MFRRWLVDEKWTFASWMFREGLCEKTSTSLSFKLSVYFLIIKYSVVELSLSLNSYEVGWNKTDDVKFEKYLALLFYFRNNRKIIKSFTQSMLYFLERFCSISVSLFLTHSCYKTINCLFLRYCEQIKIKSNFFTHFIAFIIHIICQKWASRIFL